MVFQLLLGSHTERKLTSYATRQDQKPTINDVAEAAGVAASTVSRALNAGSEGRISAQTVERIRELAVKMEYEPTHAAVSLRRKSTQTLGMLVPRMTGDGVLAVMFESAENRAESEGYVALALSTQDDPDRAAAQARRMLARNVDGLIIATATLEDPLLKELEGELPFVLLNRTSRDFPSVIADDALGGFIATAHLVSRGHTRIGYIAGPLDTSTAYYRLVGYQRALREGGIEPEEELVIEANFKPDGGLQAANRLLSLTNRPTAVFAASDYSALGAMAAARDLGFAIPRDLAIVGYNDTEIAALLPVPLTSVALPLRRMGAVAVEQLLRLLAGEQVGSVVFSPSLVPRASS